jgi:hypothetical protein
VLNGKVYPEEREQTLYIVPCLTKDMMPTEDAFTAQLVEIAEEHVSQSGLGSWVQGAGCRVQGVVCRVSKSM